MENVSKHYKKLLNLEHINKDSIILDIGANKGQSIDRFLGIFKNPTIHSFEPIKSEFDIMKKKFQKFDNIILKYNCFFLIF